MTWGLKGFCPRGRSPFNSPPSRAAELIQAQAGAGSLLTLKGSEWSCMVWKGSDVTLQPHLKLLFDPQLPGQKCCLWRNWLNCWRETLGIAQPSNLKSSQGQGQIEVPPEQGISWDCERHEGRRRKMIPLI